MFYKSHVLRKLKLGQVRSQDEWKDAKTHWSNSFAWEEINFQQKQNWATAWFYVELLCRGPNWTWVTENKHAAAWFWSTELSRGMIAQKIATSSFFTRKWMFKRKERRMARVFWLLEAGKLVGVLGFVILERLKQRLELWKRFWSFNYLVFFLFIFLSFLLSFMAILSLCICAFTLTMSS